VGCAPQQLPGAHPSERDIFLAWPRRILEARAGTGAVTVEALADLVAKGGRAPPPYILGSGASVPSTLVCPLLDALRSTRWPAQAQRSGVRTESYLVLSRELRASGHESYEELKRCCEAVMQWADPAFEYDHLAITKNFVASPHVDKEDRSHQYAMSLGDFKNGGELCVESADGQRRWMIDTRAKLARADGRSVHWVRSYSGERFSVIWYVNRERFAASQSFDVDLEWEPAGPAAADVAAVPSPRAVHSQH
jgi:hypothetical protein